MRDLCPHRGMPLSFGRLTGNGWNAPSMDGSSTRTRLTVTPTTDQECRADYCAAWNCFPGFRLESSSFVSSPKCFCLKTRSHSNGKRSVFRYKPSLMLVGDADMPAKWYYKLKAAHLASVANRTALRPSAQRTSDASLEELSAVSTMANRSATRKTPYLVLLLSAIILCSEASPGQPTAVVLQRRRH